MAKNQKVDDFLKELSHKRKSDIEALRHLILACSPEISEHVKWNAPSFCVNGDDRLTMRLHPGDRLQLILHRGTKPEDKATFQFEDRSGLIEWATPDRGVLTIPEGDFMSIRKVEIADVVKNWIAATRK